MPKRPLIDLMYFDPVYTAVVRMIGYSGKTLAEAGRQAQELAKQFPKERIQQAANELTSVDSKTGIMSLTEYARKNARGILGIEPDHPLADYWRHGPPDLMGEEAMMKWQERYRQEKENGQEEPEQPKKRARKGRTK